MDTAEHASLRSALDAQGQRILSHEDQLVQVRQEVAEATKCSDSACATLTAQLNYIIGQLQELEKTGSGGSVRIQCPAQPFHCFLPP